MTSPATDRRRDRLEPTCANAGRRASSCFVRAIQGFIARGSHASPLSATRVRPSPRPRSGAPLAEIGLRQRRAGFYGDSSSGRTKTAPCAPTTISLRTLPHWRWLHRSPAARRRKSTTFMAHHASAADWDDGVSALSLLRISKPRNSHWLDLPHICGYQTQDPSHMTLRGRVSTWRGSSHQAGRTPERRREPQAPHRPPVDQNSMFGYIPGCAANGWRQGRRARAAESAPKCGERRRCAASS